MRLIDADKFEQYIREYCADSLVDLWCELVRRQPTAYDVDQVVEKINKHSLKMSTSKPPHTYMRAIGTKEAEKIIRDGGGTEKRIKNDRGN